MVEVYVVVGPDDDGNETVLGIFFDPEDADRACAKCPGVFGGMRREYRVEERMANEIWEELWRVLR